MTKPTQDIIAQEQYEEAMRSHYSEDYETAYGQFRILYANKLRLFDPGILEMRIGACCLQLADQDDSKAEEAAEFLMLSYKLLDRVKHRFETMGMFDVLAMTMWHLGKTEETLAFMEEGLQFLDEYEPKHRSSEVAEELLFGRVSYLLLLGDCYFYHLKYAEAMATYRRAEVEIERMSNKAKALAGLLSRIGRLHHYSGDDSLAMENLSRVEPSDLSCADLGSYRFTLLRLHVGRNEYKEAIEQYELLKESGIPLNKDSQAYHFAGIAHYALRVNQVARELFRESLKYAGPEWVAERSREYLRRIGETIH